MSIFDKIKDHESSKHYKADVAEAVEVFERQKQGLRAIKDETGFKEIVAYWQRQKNAAEARFDSGVKENKTDVLARARYIEAKNFLNFLKNVLESSK